MTAITLVGERPAGVPFSKSIQVTDVETELFEVPYYKALPQTGSLSGNQALIDLPVLFEFSAPIQVVNTDATETISITVKIVRSNSDEAHLAFNFPVHPRDTLHISASGHHLFTGDKLFVQASAPTGLDLIVSGFRGQTELDDPSAFEAWVAAQV